MNKWFHSRFPKAKRRFLGTKLALEILEDRLAPATFTVTTRLDVLDANDGKLSLREAITRANNLLGADTIVVPAGVYKISIPAGPGPVNDTGAFDILDSATLQGAGAGATIVDGQHIDRVFAVTGTAPSSITVTFRGLTVRGGLVNGDGGGIVVGNADLTLRGSVVTGNTTSGKGAGISNALNPGTGDLTLIGSTVSRNVAGDTGGGISWRGDAQDQGSNLSLSNSRVWRNSASVGSGGGIRATTVTLTNSTVSGNTASANGGGIRATTVTLTNSTVSANIASANGGGILAGAVMLTNSTVSGNTASATGGGIWADAMTLVNATIAENLADTGGGIFHNGTTPATVKNTIIALNLVAFGGSGPDVSGAFTSQGFNLISDGTGSTGFTNNTNNDQVDTPQNPIDPKLGPLANNGGPTLTHALRPGSPAIDRGDNTAAPATDQRGGVRPKDGDGNGSRIVDIGAFER